MLQCKQAARLLSQAQDTPLNLAQRWQLRLHLSLCDRCRHFQRQLGFMRRAARAAARLGSSDIVS